MVTMWDSMSRIHHPTWTRTNGEIDGAVFKDWERELKPYGPQGVLRGLKRVREAGSAYVPPLNKFLSLCKNESESTDCRPGESFSEQEHGGRLKPTPNGVPLSWTIGNYSYEELMASGHPEDTEKARSLK